MYISHWASETPDAVAIRMMGARDAGGAGETLTFAELEAGSNRGAHLLRQLGLNRGDTFAVWCGSCTRYLEIVFSMQRAGLFMVPIAAKLTAPEAVYIVNDAKARVLIIDASLGAAAEEMARDAAQLCPDVEQVFAMRGTLPGCRSWEDETAAMPAISIADQSAGLAMMYSSGTTGKPKGIYRELPDQPHDAPDFYTLFHQQKFAPEPGTAFLATAPLYHTGPLAFVVSELKLGCSVVVFEKFDAEDVLAAIQDFKVQRGQFVPTMFIRMLKLPEEVRAKYDVSSIQLALHSAAPCPIEVKRAMIDWWKPVLFEIYGGTENVGSTMIDSHEWLKKPGSVGRPMQGTVHVCDEEGRELEPGETGLIYFEGNASFKYLGDDEKTRDSGHPTNPNWATFGDIGHVDEDGYLFLSDRRAFMIICGGVNIYPQEAENLLVMHPKVEDVAVFGVPDPDMGEQVKAVVQPAKGSGEGPDLEAELIAYCRAQLATLKCPKSIDFKADLPRDPTGKMMKKALRESYLASAEQAGS